MVRGATVEIDLLSVASFEIGATDFAGLTLAWYLPVIAAIEASGARAHIPSQSNVRVVRTVDPTLYRERNRIERFFNRLKHFRGIATRYFKTAANFLAALHLASARLWIRYYESTT